MALDDRPVLPGHLLLITLLETILLWNRSRGGRSCSKESGSRSARRLSLTVMLFNRVRVHAPRPPRSAFDVVVGTLMAVAVVTGIGVAVRYRWASSWSVVTLSPYLLSLVQFKPSVILIARMPFLVRLHVVCACAIVGIAPCTRLSRIVLVPLDAMAEWLRGPVAGVLSPAWRAVETWSLKGAQAVLVRRDGEEN